MMRSVLALGVLATGLVVSSAQAQPYPPPPYQPYPYGQQATIRRPGRSRRPRFRTTMTTTSRRISAPRPGNYPPPPGGYRGPFASEPRMGPGVDRGQLPPPAYARPPAVVYAPESDGYRAAAADARPIGNGQPESYGAAPQAPQP